ncbi:unnamed protein product [Periconia digitata]|uniref:Uncharacterized protein n=1 Tax=Periconia digitata TaxID=1303443 RepID=A0A9W4UP96_9PLEO|nr:unnamed protein product [Periconia digitata]
MLLPQAMFDRLMACLQAIPLASTAHLLQHLSTPISIHDTFIMKLFLVAAAASVGIVAARNVQADKPDFCVEEPPVTITVTVTQCHHSTPMVSSSAAAPPPEETTTSGLSTTGTFVVITSSAQATPPGSSGFASSAPIASESANSTSRSVSQSASEPINSASQPVSQPASESASVPATVPATVPTTIPATMPTFPSSNLTSTAVSSTIWEYSGTSSVSSTSTRKQPATATEIHDNVAALPTAFPGVFVVGVAAMAALA